MDENGKPFSLTAYSHVVDIPMSTLAKYNVGKVKVGASVGAKSIMSEEATRVLVDAIVRHDCGNTPKGVPQILDMAMDLHPLLSRKQVSDTWRRTCWKNNLDVLKPKAMIAQAMTAKRLLITVGQQYRWMKTIDRVYDHLREQNTGVYRKTGKTCGEVMHHFIIGGDETSIMASSGNVRIVGGRERKKHEINLQHPRVSITMYRTGSVGGSTGPVAFLMNGKQKYVGYTDAFLKKFGCVEGSTIAMTPTGFMTEDAWEKITQHIVTGIRSMPYIKENPQWEAIEIVDRYGARVSSLTALEYRQARLVMS
jgi:hypothetical protein